MEGAVVCYSGGEASAKVAVMAVEKYGKDNVILLNHNISSKVEHEDIKRFKSEVASHLDIKITYANAENYETMTPLEVSRMKKGFQAEQGKTFCTYWLKTKPFYEWLNNNYPASFEYPNKDIVILYGFDKAELGRIQTRSSVLGIKGYFTDYPLAYWDSPLQSIESDIGIKIPATYKIFKHANCAGCLKAGKQHWYCVYCLRPDIWEEGKAAENEIGYSIIKDNFLADLEPFFGEMKEDKHICPSEKMSYQTFWAEVKKAIPGQLNILPCECAL